MRVHSFALAAVLSAPFLTWSTPLRAGEIPVALGQSIQAAIDAAGPGDVVTVAAGTFVEDIDFKGKPIRVVGRGTASVLLGSGIGPVVRFVSGETVASVLDSFTVTGGAAAAGGGILIDRASPLIVRNVITGNRASGQGSGIAVLGPASPQIANNVLSYNRNLDGVGDPHTIQIVGATPAIVNNTIVEGDSNGILLNGTSSAATIIVNNVIAVNGTPGEGRGRGICDFSGGAVIQYNTFFRNVVAALLTRDGQYRRVRAAERAFADPDFHANSDRSPRFVDLRHGDFRLRPTSPALHAGHPDPAFANRDGTRNTMGHTGGPWAPRDATIRCRT